MSSIIIIVAVMAFLAGCEVGYSKADDMEIKAKLGQRKTVHLWLNELGVPKVEATGKPMCLLRRLAVALKIQPYETKEAK